MKIKKPIPKSPLAWLHEIAEAYLDAAEAIPFGKAAGQEFDESELYHLAPAVCLKFRGLKRSRKNLNKATKAALTSYVASQEICGDLFDTPQITFAFCYLASHYGLDLADKTLFDSVMEFIESQKNTLIELTQ